MIGREFHVETLHQLNRYNKDLNDPGKNHCPYCDAVHFGEKDEKWLPSLKGDDIKLKGFHKV